MKIIISNISSEPIYEQIASQIRNQVINGKIDGGDKLPSIRALAKYLEISVITTKKAYERLEQEGFIYTVKGKGSFITEQDFSFIKEQKINKLEIEIINVIKMARELEMTKQELKELINTLLEEELK